MITKTMTCLMRRLSSDSGSGSSSLKSELKSLNLGANVALRDFDGTGLASLAILRYTHQSLGET